MNSKHLPLDLLNNGIFPVAVLKKRHDQLPYLVAKGPASIVACLLKLLQQPALSSGICSTKLAMLVVTFNTCDAILYDHLLNDRNHIASK